MPGLPRGCQPRTRACLRRRPWGSSRKGVTKPPGNHPSQSHGPLLAPKPVPCLRDPPRSEPLGPLARAREPATALKTLTWMCSGSPCRFPGCWQVELHRVHTLSSWQQEQTAPGGPGPLRRETEAQHCQATLRRAGRGSLGLLKQNFTEPAGRGRDSSEPQPRSVTCSSVRALSLGSLRRLLSKTVLVRALGWDGNGSGGGEMQLMEEGWGNA